MPAPETKFKIIDNIYVREMVFAKAGDVLEGHRHIWSHPTIVGSGGVIVEIEGKPAKEYPERSIIYIAKGLHHKLTATKDNTAVYCVHAIRTGDQVGDILDPDDHPLGTDIRRLMKPLTIPDDKKGAA